MSDIKRSILRARVACNIYLRYKGTLLPLMYLALMPLYIGLFTYLYVGTSEFWGGVLAAMGVHIMIRELKNFYANRPVAKNAFVQREISKVG